MAIRAFADAKRAMAGLLAVVGLTISGALTIGSSGSFTNSSTTTSTFAGAVSSTRYIANSGSATAPAFSFNGNTNYGMYWSVGNLEFAVNGARRMGLSSSAMTLFGNLTSDGNPRDIGSTGFGFRNGLFSGTVTSTNFEIGTAGGAYRSLITGSASAPAFCFDDGTDGCNDGMYQHAVDGISFATNGSQKLRIGTTAVQILAGFDFTGTSAGTSDLGSLAAPFGDVFAQSVSTTGLIVNPSTGTPVASLCLDAGGNVIKVIGANCF